MPLATIHLISLTKSTSVASFISRLQSTSVRTLVISKVVRWIITPTTIDASALLNPSKPWDLLVIALGTDALPESLQSKIECHWTCVAGIPSRLTGDFASTNAKLLHPDRSSVPALTGSLSNPRVGTTSQTLELSPALSSWTAEFARTPTGQAPLSMLNLLAFKPGMKESYLEYGRAFASSIGARRGGSAKLVGNVVEQQTAPPDTVWDEFALATYPSILHFADMLASEDYQAVNLKFRVPALADTFILCTSEIEVEELMKRDAEGDMGVWKRSLGKL